MNNKLKWPIYLLFTVSLLSGCSKDDADQNEEYILKNSTWVATTVDANPDTNPPGQFGANGNNNYYPWLDCQLDDSFTFSQGNLTIDDNGTNCEVDFVIDNKVQAFSYNAESKQLTVGEGQDPIIFTVYELNKDRLKLGLSLVAPGGGANLVFLFKRK
ncbi:hypothetical protein [Sphingobacterium sp. LRF_L2]|uniref:hypothetical protein n=1 Tax=Sphingobacterium sp. LRF_L2 TaxID=3369421 RepID=UPI003F61CF93